MITKDEINGRIRTLEARHGTLSVEVTRTARTEAEAASGAPEKFCMIVLREGGFEASPVYASQPLLRLLGEVLEAIGVCDFLRADAAQCSTHSREVTNSADTTTP